MDPLTQTAVTAIAVWLAVVGLLCGLIFFVLPRLLEAGAKMERRLLALKRLRRLGRRQT